MYSTCDDLVGQCGALFNMTCGVCVEVHVLGHAGGDGDPEGPGGGLWCGRGGTRQRSAGRSPVLRFIQRHQQLCAEYQGRA